MVAANDRVPCPQCGGLIHPISGKCKHCKADLATGRGARISAPVALPSLVASATPPPVQAAAAEAPSPWAPPGKQPYSPVRGATNGAAPTAPLAGMDSQPVLPPRVTARQQAVAMPSDRAWWKSWPILVIIVASLAIVVAIVLLVLPGSHGGGAKSNLPPGPAPDRMDTDPTVPGANGLPQQDTPPKSGQNNGATPTTPPNVDPADPNAGSGGHVRPPPPDPVTPDPQADPDDDLGGILGGGGGNSAGGLGGLGNALGKSPGMMGAMLEHGCARASTCSTDPMLKQACSQIGPMLKQMPKNLPSCAAAQQCLDQIDALDCNTKLDDLSGILSLNTKIAACVDALQCS